MAITDHLQSKTFWEKRCSLMEESLFRIVAILNATILPPHVAAELTAHMNDWDRLMGELCEEYSPPKEPEQP